MKTKASLLSLVTPGEILTREFLAPPGLTEYRLAKDIAAPPRQFRAWDSGLSSAESPRHPA